MAPQYGEARVDYITYTTGVVPNEGNATAYVSGLINNPTFSGNVIIEGNATINGNLNVSGDINASGVVISGITGLFDAGTETLPSIAFALDPDTGIYNPTANEIGFSTGGAERVRIDNTGNVGIGTDIPGRNLTIFGASFPTLQIADTAAGTAATDGTLIQHGGGDTYLVNRESGNFRFVVDASEKVRIDANGNVGIGSSTPDQILDLQANATGSVAGPFLRFTDGYSGGWTANTDSSGLEFFSADPSGPGIGVRSKIANTIEDTSGAAQALTFWTTTNTSGQALTERLRIAHDGDVGIGTTSPDAKLEVSGTNVTAKIRLTSISNGRNTFDPDEASISLTAASMNTTAKYTPSINFGSTDSAFTTTNPKFGAAINATAATSYTADNKRGMDLNFWTATTANGTDHGLVQRMIIEANGDVGIGTTNPASSLHIASSSPRFTLTDTDTGVNHRINADSSAGNLAFDVDLNSATSAPSCVFNIKGSERVRIDSTGRLLVGTATAYFTPTSTINAPLLQTHSTNPNAAQCMVTSWSTGTNVGASLSLCRSDSGTVGTYSPAIGSSDVLGNVRFNGSDGTKFIEGARIAASADGTWATDDGPAKLTFFTTADGASSVTERMTINSSGRVTVNSGFITLNGNKLGAIRVVIASDAFATITPPRAGCGYVTVVEGGDETFPNANCRGFLYADWNSSPVATGIDLGSAFETSTAGPPTGTTGSDSHATLFVGGVDGTLYLENRLGVSIFFVNFI